MYIYHPYGWYMDGEYGPVKRDLTLLSRRARPRHMEEVRSAAAG